MNVNYIDWHIAPSRASRWARIWMPALKIALAYGASSCLLTRSEDDPLHFRQISVWEDRADFERYWFSDEISALRMEAQPYYGKPVNPAWSNLIADAEHLQAPTA